MSEQCNDAPFGDVFHHRTDSAFFLNSSGEPPSSSSSSLSQLPNDINKIAYVHYGSGGGSGSGSGMAELGPILPNSANVEYSGDSSCAYVAPEPFKYVLPNLNCLFESQRNARQYEQLYSRRAVSSPISSGCSDSGFSSTSSSMSATPPSESSSNSALHLELSELGLSLSKLALHAEGTPIIVCEEGGGGSGSKRNANGTQTRPNNRRRSYRLLQPPPPPPIVAQSGGGGGGAYFYPGDDRFISLASYRFQNNTTAAASAYFYNQQFAPSATAAVTPTLPSYDLQLHQQLAAASGQLYMHHHHHHYHYHHHMHSEKSFKDSQNGGGGAGGGNIGRYYTEPQNQLTDDVCQCLRTLNNSNNHSFDKLNRVNFTKGDDLFKAKDICELNGGRNVGRFYSPIGRLHSLSTSASATAVISSKSSDETSSVDGSNSSDALEECNLESELSLHSYISTTANPSTSTVYPSYGDNSQMHNRLLLSTPTPPPLRSLLEVDAYASDSMSSSSASCTSTIFPHDQHLLLDIEQLGHYSAQSTSPSLSTTTTTSALIKQIPRPIKPRKRKRKEKIAKMCMSTIGHTAPDLFSTASTCTDTVQHYSSSYESEIRSFDSFETHSKLRSKSKCN